MRVHIYHKMPDNIYILIRVMNWILPDNNIIQQLFYDNYLIETIQNYISIHPASKLKIKIIYFRKQEDVIHFFFLGYSQEMKA